MRIAVRTLSLEGEARNNPVMSRRSRRRGRQRLALLHHVLGARAATATIEFAVAGPVFLLFVFMILDTSLQLATKAALDSAAARAARLIRIGTITGGNYSSTLASDICANVVLIPSCTANIQVYVAAAPSTGSQGTSPAGSGFSSVSLARVSGGTMTSTKAALSADDDVILEVGYQRPFSVPWLSLVAGGNGTMLISTMAFQTEPY